MTDSQTPRQISTYGIRTQEQNISIEQHIENSRQWERRTEPCGNCQRRISPDSRRCPCCGQSR